MAEIRCIAPDCEFVAADPDPERAKRQIVSHINESHDEAHVIIACAHDMALLAAFEATAKTPGGKEVSLPQERYQCRRCDQYEVRAAG